MLVFLFLEFYLFFCREWEQIWTKNKEQLVNRFKKSKKLALMTNIEHMKNEVQTHGEVAVQDLTDFVKGLDLIADLGL